MGVLDDLLRDRMEIAHVPGAVLMRTLDGKVEISAAGVTSLENPLPVEGQTLAQVGSVSKTFTATACARLAARGDLDLDAPVRSYLPEFHVADAGVSARVTPRMLLCHTGGFLGDHFPDTGAGEDALARALAGMHALPQIAPAGEVRSYCNSGFMVLGRLLEVLTGETLEAALRGLVFEPAGLANTWLDADEVMTRRFVVGHVWQWSGARNRVARPWGLPRASAAVGGVVSCAEDLAAYAHMHLGDDPALAGMREPQPPLGQGWTTGLSWFVREYAGEAIAEHGGTTLGQTCWLALVPGRRYAVAVLTNSSRGGEVFRPLVRAALREDLGLHEPEPAPVDVEPERVAAVAGSYTGQLADYDLEPEAGGLALVHRPKGGFPTPASPPGPAMPRVRTRFSAPDRLLFLDPPITGTEADVHWDGDRPDWIRIGSRVCRRRGTGHARVEAAGSERWVESGL